MRIARLLFSLGIAATVIAADGDDAAALKQRVAELERQVQELSANAVAFRTIIEVDAQVWLAGDPGRDDGHFITPKLAKFLGLSAEETAKLEQASTQARTALAAAIDAQHPKAEVNGPATVLVIHDFSAAGRPIEIAFQKAWRDVLGVDRYRVLKRMVRGSDNQTWLNFGEGTNTFTFTRRADGGLDYRHEVKADHLGGSTSGQVEPGNHAQFALIIPYVPKGFFDQAVPAAGAAKQPEHVPGGDNF